MKFDQLTTPKTGKPSSKKGSSCVITSRIRLARNIEEHPYPGWATKEQRSETYQVLHSALQELPLYKSGYYQSLDQLELIQKQVLVEQHMMSRELAARGEGCALAVNKARSIFIMVNEEDHLRLQAIEPGLNLKKAFRAIDKVDTQLSEHLHYGYLTDWGYLTSCPTNLGTGMRASVMLHLPALGILDEISQVLKAVSKLGLAIRGFYGEGTESLANLYQISNQSTLGESEAEIIARIERITKHVIKAEETARQKLLLDSPDILQDKVGRAYGILKHSTIISSKEALSLLSLLRLGCEVDLLPPETMPLCDALMIQIQPAHLQLEAGGKLSIEERDRKRAQLISTQLENITPPNYSLDAINPPTDTLT